jgi:uncharacterized protein YgiM (DUF1202 family)
MISFSYGEEKIEGLVVGNNVNVRQEPKMEAAVLSTLKLGEYVSIVKSSGEWYGITLNDENIGWVHNKLVITVDEEKDLIKKGIVTANVLNIRDKPDITGSNIGKVTKGTEITIIDKNSTWYGIDVDNKKGWIHSDYISIKNNYKTGKITGSKVNVRKDPSQEGEIIDSLNLDSYVQVKGFKEDWYHIIVKENQEGWIYKDYITIIIEDTAMTSRGSSRSSLGVKAIAIAKSQLGKKYVYGASGPNAFDCSGFTSYVYKKMGIELPRTSRGQATVGQKVARNNLEIGDLVFFDTNGGNNGRISHVGIYMGDGNFIHASTGSRKIRITSLNSSYYKGRFVTARRFF